MITALRYLKEDPIFEKDVPYELFGHPNQPSERITNCHYVLREGVVVHDVRDSNEAFTLESTGFKYVKHQTKHPLKAEYFEKVGNTYKSDDVVTAYLEESIAVLKEQLGIDKVICFDWRFRRSGAPPRGNPNDDDVFDIRAQAVSPGLDAHCDFSQRGGMERLQMHLLPEELELLSSRKYKAKIINTWRPFRTVKNAPLVITDRRSVQPDDLVEVEKIIPDKIERAYYLLHRTHTKWYYMSDQTEQDVAIFTTWDCEMLENFAGAPPHGAASQFDEQFETNPRESIEVRFICFFPTENLA